MTAIFMIAKNTLVESLRRRDIYVLAVISFVLIGVSCFVTFWGASGLQRFLTDVSMTVIGVCSTIIAIVVTARQLPSEMESRTLYPLLAKPLSRSGYLVGKFLGCWAIAVFSMLFFTAAFLFALLVVVRGGVGFILVQALFARALMLGVVVSLTLLLSTFLTHSANVTIMLLGSFGVRLVSSTILLFVNKVEPFTAITMKAFYYVIPHLELFDLSRKVVHVWQPVPAWVLFGLSAYAAVYVILPLTFASLIFSRKSL